MSSIYEQLESGDAQKNQSEVSHKKKVLGKGLNALISDLYGKSKNENEANETKNILDSMAPFPGASSGGQTKSGIQEIALSQIQPNPEQPRTFFSEDTIQELADSIKEQGMIQPVIVKKAAKGYELVCGERRLRAAQQIGLDKIPAIVKEIAEDKLLEWALIENIQREDLNPIEEAQAYLRLAEEKQWSHEEIGKKVGKDRTTIVNAIRLLRLPKDVLTLLVEGKIQSGHARALLSLPTAELQTKMSQRIVKEGLTVRQVEEWVTASLKRKRRAKRVRAVTPEQRDLETKMEERLGTEVRIYPLKDNKQGHLEIKYYSLDDLDRILGILGISKL